MVQFAIHAPAFSNSAARGIHTFEQANLSAEIGGHYHGMTEDENGF